jgi:hypothetical protein
MTGKAKPKYGRRVRCTNATRPRQAELPVDAPSASWCQSRIKRKEGRKKKIVRKSILWNAEQGSRLPKDEKKKKKRTASSDVGGVPIKAEARLPEGKSRNV